MKFGAHLPLIGFSGEPPSLRGLVDYATAAREMGFSTLAVNDHLVFPRPWLDGPAALAAVLEASGAMQLMTSVSVPVVRGPVQTAKSLGAIDLLSGGRLIVGVGPGSSPRDYEAVGVPFEERWKRLDEMVPALRALWRGEDYRGRFYSTEGIRLEPRPARVPPVWIGSWGSEHGMRRVARLGDGWLASAYNTTPERFREARERLERELRARKRDAESFPNGIATMFMCITDTQAEGQRVLRDVIVPFIPRPEDELAAQLLIGPAEECAAKLSAYSKSGAQLVLLWPIRDEMPQLERFARDVQPLAG